MPVNGDANAIVVGYDDTDGSKAALAESIGLARDLGAELVVVFGYAPRTIEREARDYIDALEEIGGKATAEAVAKATEAGVTAEAVVRGERAAESLVNVAEEHDARMIVVGSYGERPLAGAILGSVPHRLVHLSQRPVLVVRADG